MSGPQPKPTLIKVLSGNPGGRPLNKNEPIPPGVLVDPPAWMTESQKAGWRYAIENAPKGLLRRLDSALLTVWVVAEDAHREATQRVAETGLLVPSTVQSVLIQSPYLPIINRQALIMLKAANDLGFSPTSRTKLTAPSSDNDSRFGNNGRRPA